MILTVNQLERSESELSKIAREPVTVQQMGSALYAFGSELATLRIFAKYNANGSHPNPKCRVGHSENLKTFYFCLDL